LPEFNRRGFFQLLAAVGATTLVPALPARAVVTGGGASVSKMLWAGLYAHSGSAPKFVGVAKGMGLSYAAIQGVSARSVGVRVAAAAATERLTAAQALEPPAPAGGVRQFLEQGLERVFADEAEDEAETGAVQGSDSLRD
jgi:hypothetical protein